jgi:hypothetical protein
MSWSAPLPQYGGYLIGDGKGRTRSVTRSQYRANSRRLGYLHRSMALRRLRGARGRKRAVLAAFPLRGCEHEYSYHEDTIGADDVINGTYTECWLECDHCGARQAADWRDAPYDDDWL